MSCDNWLESLYDSHPRADCSEARLILLKSRGGLSFPSLCLKSLLNLLEASVQKQTSNVSSFTYSHVLNDILTNPNLPRSAIGCEIHACSLTSRCIHFYVTTRLHFLNSCINKERASKQQKHKHKKLSKLT